MTLLSVVHASVLSPLVVQSLTTATQGLQASSRQLRAGLAFLYQNLPAGDRTLWQLVHLDFELLEDKVLLVAPECPAHEHLVHCLGVVRRFLFAMDVLPVGSRQAGRKRRRDDSGFASHRSWR